MHRDLKCSNVLLDGAGRARLADFALAARRARAPDGGSPYNASPQQLRGEPAQPADDLYAFGALLYELIAGHPPYYPEITRDRVLHEPVPPLVPRGVVPVGVRELALRLLAKSPRRAPGERAADRACAPRRRRGRRRRRAGAARRTRCRLRRPPRAARQPPGCRSRSRAAVLAAVAAVIWLPQDALGGHGLRAQGARRKRSGQGRAPAVCGAGARFAARPPGLAEAARGRFDTAFKALDARAAARWATAEFAEARDARRPRGRTASPSGDFAAAASGWDKASANLADARESSCRRR